MNCPHCNMPQRRDYLLEFRCGTQRQVRGVTRSDECHGNEIAQLRAKVLRLMQAGNALADFNSFATVQAWNIAKEEK